jgi:hypothetical protein
MWPIFEPGSTIVATEAWRDRLWSAAPHLVVTSDTDILVTYQPAGAVSIVSSNRDMAYTRGMSRSERKLAALETLQVSPKQVYETPTKLYFYTPGSWARINLGWDPSDGHFMGWYVNFELPAEHMADGLISKDLVLDIYVNPDLTWEWKDEQEFTEAIDRNLIDAHLRDTLATEADRVLAQVAAGEGAFDPRCDPRWQAFHAPEHWATPSLPSDYAVTGSAWRG